MLELRPNCECCGTELAPDSPDTWICSFECTYCGDCRGRVLAGRCPNCGGDLERRPVRPAGLLEKYPASTVRVVRKDGCAGNVA